ncbi:VOC family protein [Brevibacterium samyangense]|uniref:VOC family protein n=1 Tax=Brevibacterium samyangense TaxID=366888 RepID=A0ABP5F571_9MICO
MAIGTGGAAARIMPYLWFTDNAREALEYYTSVFPNSSIGEVQYYPEATSEEHLRDMQGKILHAEFVLDGQRFGAIDGGPAFTFTEAVSFVVWCADQAEIDRYWSALSHVPESEACGWCKDRFGLSWQILPADLGSLMRIPAQQSALMRMKKIDIAELAGLG